MTPLFITLLTRQVKLSLPGCRLSAIGQPDGEAVTLTFFNPKERNFHLVLALFSTRPYLFLTRQKIASRKVPGNFIRSLRKHLEYARVESVTHSSGERIIGLELRTGEGATSRLIFEALPKYPNLILVGPDGNIISAVHYKDDVVRPVVPGAVYRPPPRPVDKPDLWTADELTLRSLLKSDAPMDLRDLLKEKARGTDPETLRHLTEVGGDPVDAILSIRNRLGSDWGQVFLTGSIPASLRLFPDLQNIPADAQLFKDVHEAGEALFEREREQRTYHQERKILEQEIARVLKREKKVLEKVKEDRARAERADQYQWWGELLMAQLHLIPPHASNVELADVARGTDQLISIPLDPETSAVQNAQKYFSKSRKGVRGLALVEKREKGVLERLNELKSAQRSLPALMRVEEIRKAMKDLFPKVVRESIPKPNPISSIERAPTPNIKREKISKEFELCAGASAVANEYVTFQLAQPDDLWFHARDLPGAHVILRKLQRNAKFTDELVLRAAQYAAEHSKAKAGAKVTVSYAEKKYVRRIPGAPTGMVTLTKERSLFIDLPDVPPGTKP